MSRMRDTRDHESNLDALLEDLQTTVSRSNSNVNLNGNVTGYRSIRRTTTDGTQDGTTSEYHVEYLNPANTTHHINETSYNGGLPGGHKSKSVTSYKYTTSERSSGMSGDTKMKNNISELDSLLDDLNTAQKKSFSSSSVVTTKRSGVDSSLIEPTVTSTPRGIRKEYREERSLRGRSPSPRRELVFTGPRSRDPSPVEYHSSFVQQESTPTVQQFYRYEKTTSTKTTGPVVTDISGGIDPPGISRSYTYNVEEEGKPLAITQRSPSPSGQVYSATSHYTTRETSQDRVGSGQEPDFNSPRYGSCNKSYSYSSNAVRESRPTHGTSPYPNPPRSPSPQRFSPSDPSHKLTYNVSPTHGTQSTYKYSSTTSTNYNDEYSLKPRPFPTTPGEQQPPKKLDDLLASFSDSHHESHIHDRYADTSASKYYSSNGPPPPPMAPEPKHGQMEIRERVIEKEHVKERDESKNTSGPPVYYPPGVELFSKKEESAMAAQSGGGMYKAKAKYEYEAKSKSKSKESSGKAVVPVCLPVCCAMPCSLM